MSVQLFSYLCFPTYQNKDRKPCTRLPSAPANMTINISRTSFEIVSAWKKNPTFSVAGAVESRLASHEQRLALFYTCFAYK